MASGAFRGARACDRPERMSVPRFPAPLSAEDVPKHLRDNTLVLHLLALTPSEERELAALAASDAAEDERTAAEIVASVR